MKFTTNNSIGRLSIVNGGIRIGEGIKRIKVSASVCYHNYNAYGEVDLKITKYNDSTGQHIPIAGINGESYTQNGINNIVINPTIAEVSPSDRIYMVIVKGNAVPLTVLAGINATSLTVEAVN